MDTIIAKVNKENLDEPESKEALYKAAEIIRTGGLVAFPTETVYGLGGNALDKEASKKIYAAKGRPSDNPLIVHICSLDQLYEIASEVTPEMKTLAEKFWPGPMTMIVNSNGKVPHETTGGLDTVAVRFPVHPVAMALIRESGCMIAAPSANTSGRPSPTKASHVEEDLSGKIDMILDGGEVNIGLESTIVDMTVDEPTILRPGFITIEDIKETLGSCKMDPGLSSENANVRPKAPGMRYRHYAPKAQLSIVEGEREKVITKIVALATESEQNGVKTAVLCSDESRADYKILEYLGVQIFDMGSFETEDDIARNLFDVLRKCDDLQVGRIFSESFDTKRLGNAIMNRLLKAAGHSVVEA